MGFINLALLAGRMGTAHWFDDRGWYMAKMPFTPDSLPVMARHTAAVLAARLGLSRRAIVLDLDNTLWGGVIGDDGLAGIVLGGGTAGEAFQDFQVALKELVGRGIVLAVCSKNDPEVALAPFRDHPEMVLKEDDIAAFVANWEPKSTNIRRIADTLGLGLDSLTFLDDNPYERAEVRRALPRGRRADPARRSDRLPPRAGGLSLFRAGGLHRRRPRARRPVPGARRRRSSCASAGSLEDYQAGLEMTARLGGDRRGSGHGPRACSSSTRPTSSTSPPGGATRPSSRPSSPGPGAIGLQVRLADRFADHGLIAVALAEVARTDGRRLEIDTLLMSCRVLGRGVEALVLAELARLATEAGCAAVTGAYLPTGRNGMVADLYPRHGFVKTAEKGGATRWSADPAALTAPGTRIHLIRD